MHQLTKLSFGSLFVLELVPVQIYVYRSIENFFRAKKVNYKQSSKFANCFWKFWKYCDIIRKLFVLKISRLSTMKENWCIRIKKL